MDGFYKLRSLRAGKPVAREVNPTMQFCFAIGARVLGNIYLVRRMSPSGYGGGCLDRVIEKWHVDGGWWGDTSSPVIDNLCEQVEETMLPLHVVFILTPRPERSNPP